MLYYAELDLRFGREPSKDLVELINQLDTEIAQKCDFYLEEDRFVQP